VKGERKDEGVETETPPRKIKEQVKKTKVTKFVQINSHNSKAATTVLYWQVTVGIADVALIQEPWIYGGQTRGSTKSGETIFFCCMR
jgi:hypothetical protein